MGAPKDPVKYEEWKRKISENNARWWKGKKRGPQSSEHIDKRIQSQIGCEGWRKGLTKETDERVRKHSEILTGRKLPPFSDKHCKNISKSAKNKYKDPIKREITSCSLKKFVKDHPEIKENLRERLKKHVQEDGWETHHIDENRDNNDPSNLQDVYWSVHKRIHNMRNHLRRKYSLLTIT